MEKTNAIPTAVAAAAAVFFLCLPAGASDYRKAAGDLARSARQAAVERVAVVEFSAKAGAGRHEAAYAAEKVGAALSLQSSPEVVERAQLEKVMKERKLAAATGRADAGDGALFTVDAVVSGTVYASGDKLKVLIRLINIRSGKVLFASELETERMDNDAWEAFGDEGLPEVSMPSLGGWPSTTGFRDAVSARGAASCSERREEAARSGSALLEAKARYWALKLREPGFSSASLRRNPGSEIADRGERAEFYRLLADYAKAPVKPYLSAAQAAVVLDQLVMELKIIDDCGQI